MSKIQTLRVLVSRMLTAAAEEIFEVFERTMAEYEEELWRQRKLLDAVFKPQVRLHRTDVQQLVQNTEEVLTEQQRLTSSLDQEEPPELAYIEDEEEEFWNHQVEGEEEQDNITMFTFTPVSVKSEEGDEEHPQSSQLHHRQSEKRKTGSDGEDCGGPEPFRNSDGPLQAERSDQEIVEARWGLPTATSRTDVQLLLKDKDVPAEQQEWSLSLDQLEPDEDEDEEEELWSSQDEEELERDDASKFTFTPVKSRHGDDEGQPRPSHLHQRQMKPGADGEDCGGPEPARNSDPDRHFLPEYDCVDQEELFEPRSGLPFVVSNSEKKTFSCSECGKQFNTNAHLVRHKKLHTREKPFSCSVCGKRFMYKASLANHMVVHTEKRYNCSICGKRFHILLHLKIHQTVGCKFLKTRKIPKVKTEAGGVEPVKTSGPGLSQPDTHDSNPWKKTSKPQSGLNLGERNNAEFKSGKMFSCSECGKQFKGNYELKTHFRKHTGERPFSCPVCNKKFMYKSNVAKHTKIHAKDQPGDLRLMKHQTVCHQSSQLHGRKAEQMRTEAGEAEPVRILGPGLSQAETHDGNPGKTSKPQSGLNFEEKTNAAFKSGKMFSCAECGKQFKRNSHLTMHSIKHTKEKPFGCPVCNKKFKYKSTVPKHMKIHTKNQPGDLHLLKHQAVCPQSSQLHDGQTEQMTTDAGGAQESQTPISAPDKLLQPLDPDEPEMTDDSDDWEETGEL